MKSTVGPKLKSARSGERTKNCPKRAVAMIFLGIGSPFPIFSLFFFFFPEKMNIFVPTPLTEKILKNSQKKVGHRRKIKTNLGRTQTHLKGHR